MNKSSYRTSALKSFNIGSSFAQRVIAQSFMLAFATIICATSISKAQSIRNIMDASSNGHFLLQGSDGGSRMDMVLLSSKEVAEIRNSAIAIEHKTPLRQMEVRMTTNPAEAALLSDITSQVQSISAGHEGVFSTPLASASAVKILDQKTLHVTIHFDPTVEGGILHIVADIRPAFSGIGVANVPTAVKSATEAVEEFTPEKISQLVTTLAENLLQSNLSANTVTVN